MLLRYYHVLLLMLVWILVFDRLLLAANRQISLDFDFFDRRCQELLLILPILLGHLMRLAHTSKGNND